ncbi:interferon-induced transmembrane protein 3-like isoform X2 [Tachysurus ichikawai]
MQSAMVPLNAQPGSAGAGTVVVVMPEHPADYVVWSIANIVYGNPCCLGLLAFYFSIKSRDRKMVGDLTGATSYGSKACCVNGFALGLIILMFIVIIAVVATTGAVVNNTINRYPQYYHT